MPPATGRASCRCAKPSTAAPRQGQWVYSAGNVPYHTDGGAGGEVYVGDGERTGVDFGYWHGFRLVHVAPDGRITTDTVPSFTPGTLMARGPDRLTTGGRATWTASGRQPPTDGPKVELELRPPSASRPIGPTSPRPPTSGPPATPR